jgi:hypothetical protein
VAYGGFRPYNLQSKVAVWGDTFKSNGGMIPFSKQLMERQFFREIPVQRSNGPTNKEIVIFYIDLLDG